MTTDKNSLQKQHAIVIGGSMGGMLAARVLTDHFERVTIVDRDTFPESPEHRKGVPQSLHAHGLLAKGQLIIEQLFPDILREMWAAGATAEGALVIVSPVGKLPTFGGDGNSSHDESSDDNPGGGGVFASRIFLEWHVRRRLKAFDGIRILSATEVTSLMATDDQKRITGVKIRRRDDAGSIDLLEADLVVDASGRNSKISNWLQELGYNAVPEESINSDIGYASRFYEKPANFPKDWSAIIINGRPPNNPRAGLILPIEENKWHVTVGGMAGHHPPTDEAGFMQWARDLPDPSLYEAIRVAKPLTPIRGYRTPTNQLRHFERLSRWPKGLIVTGDSVCAFNPIYGQGMSTSAMDAMALEQVLRQPGGMDAESFERAFQQAVAETVAAPWLIATGEDLRWEGVRLSGAQGRFGTRLLHRYMDLYLRQACRDESLAGAYMAVLNLLIPPKVLLTPSIMARVLLGTVRSWFKGDKAAEDSALSPQSLAELRSRSAISV